MEGQWSELQELLGERLREGRTRSDSLNAYEKLKEDVLTWLSRMEGSIDALQPVAVDQELLKKQSDELKVGAQPHRTTARTVSATGQRVGRDTCQPWSARLLSGAWAVNVTPRWCVDSR